MSRVRVVSISIALVLCAMVNVESLFELQCADNEEKMDVQFAWRNGIRL